MGVHSSPYPSETRSDSRVVEDTRASQTVAEEACPLVEDLQTVRLRPIPQGVNLH